LLADASGKIEKYGPQGNDPCDCIESLTIVTHGLSGCVSFGMGNLLNGSSLDADRIFQMQRKAGTIKPSMCDEGSLNIIACSSGAGQSGQRLGGVLQQIFGEGVEVTLQTTDIKVNDQGEIHSPADENADPLVIPGVKPE